MQWKIYTKSDQEALDNLANNVRESLNDQTEDIQDYLNSISEEQAKTMQALKERLDKMVMTTNWNRR